MIARLKQIAAEEGLPLGDRTKTYNSRLAQELAKWAEAEGKGEEYHRAVFHAYFADGRNIAKVSTLVDIVRSIGLAAGQAEKVLAERTFRQPVDLDWSRSHALGVTAVPTFFIRRQSLVGAQPYHVLEQFVRSYLRHS
jgi:predicted DsbA family dithiol-disulfide isomerase